MRRSALERYLSSSAASDNDSEYVTDLTSVDEDTNRGDVSNMQMADEECLQEHAYPPEYYRAHAQNINKLDIIQINYTDLTIPCNVNSGPQVIDKNQPIRLTEFGARTQKYYGVPARTTYSKHLNVARDRLLDLLKL